MAATSDDINPYEQYQKDNLGAWNAIAGYWDESQSPVGADGRPDDGNDMFTQCLLPVVEELVDFQPGQRVLDLGAGSGILPRRFAKKGAIVTGLDFSWPMLNIAKQRTEVEKNSWKGEVPYGEVSYDFIDLMNPKSMSDFYSKNEKFDIITISTTLKSLPSIDPIAEALPSMLKPGGRIVIVDLHPAFSKPAGHRGMEILEDPTTGKQVLQTYIKVPQYLDIKPSYSEAVRGQPEPLLIFHRPFHKLLEPFFRNGLVLDAMREPAFTGEPDIKQAQSYHNFQQTPMLLAFRLRHMRTA